MGLLSQLDEQVNILEIGAGAQPLGLRLLQHQNRFGHTPGKDTSTELRSRTLTVAKYVATDAWIDSQVFSSVVQGFRGLGDNERTRAHLMLAASYYQVCSGRHSLGLRRDGWHLIILGPRCGGPSTVTVGATLRAYWPRLRSGGILLGYHRSLVAARIFATSRGVQVVHSCATQRVVPQGFWFVQKSRNRHALRGVFPIAPGTALPSGVANRAGSSHTSAAVAVPLQEVGNQAETVPQQPLAALMKGVPKEEILQALARSEFRPGVLRQSASAQLRATPRHRGASATGVRRDDGARDEVEFPQPLASKGGLWGEAASDALKAQGIPKRIWQTLNMKTRIPPQIARVLDMWKHQNQEYAYELHDGADMRRLLVQEFDDTFVHIFDSLGQYQQKSDLWRLCVLFLYGGVYVDADYAPLSPLRDYLPHGVELALPLCAPLVIEPMQPPLGCHSRPEAMKRLQNGFIAAAPRHPVMLLALQRLRWNFFRRESQNYLTAMGPALLFQAYADLYGDPLGDVARGPHKLGALLAPDVERYIGTMHHPQVLLLLDTESSIWTLEAGGQAQQRMLHKYPGWVEGVAKIRADNASRVRARGTCLVNFR